MVGVILPQPSPDQAVDILAIQQLAVSYSEAVSRHQIAEAIETYADDGVLEAPGGRFVGRAAVTEAITAAAAEYDLLFQTTHLGLIRVDGDRAWTRFPFTEWQRRASDQAGGQFLGMYDDEVIRTADGWRFAHRRLRPITKGRPSYFTGRVMDIPSPSFGE
jgi:ketosteroid isomerase-like protein